jgi:uncharacterized protein (DUF1778 family)
VSTKSEQLQIRLTSQQKSALKGLARRAGQDVSSYVLQRVLPPARMRFEEIARGLKNSDDVRYALAELNDLLADLTGSELADAVAGVPPELHALGPYLQNYVAAMVEQACYLRKVVPPAWVRQIAPLDEPHFAAPLRSLRLYLLRVAPVPFKRRNIFIDASIGARV